jgi:hypothetical protein
MTKYLVNLTYQSAKLSTGLYMRSDSLRLCPRSSLRIKMWGDAQKKPTRNLLFRASPYIDMHTLAILDPTVLKKHKARTSKLKNTNESSGGTPDTQCNPSACQITANANTTPEVGTLQPKTTTPGWNILLHDLGKASALSTYLPTCAGAEHIGAISKTHSGELHTLHRKHNTNFSLGLGVDLC